MWIFTFPSKRWRKWKFLEMRAAVRFFTGGFESPATWTATDLDLIIVVLRIAAATSSIVSRLIRWRRRRTKPMTRTSNTAAPRRRRCRSWQGARPGMPLRRASSLEVAQHAAEILSFSFPAGFEFQTQITILIFFSHVFFSELLFLPLNHISKHMLSVEQNGQQTSWKNFKNIINDKVQLINKKIILYDWRFSKSTKK